MIDDQVASLRPSINQLIKSTTVSLAYMLCRRSAEIAV